jgi:peptide/nickel transport system permease protein
LQTLGYDKFALAAAIFLVVIVLLAVVGPFVFSGQANAVNLRARNAPPLSLQYGWQFLLGADSLGRSLLARIAIGARTTLSIACSAVLASMFVGGFFGLIAGYARPAIGQAIMRLTDIVMSFPSLLLALVVLYLLGSSVTNVIIVLAITRIPVYLRTARAEVLEIKQRTFIVASLTLGARSGRIVFRHILPLIIPTLLTIASIDFAAVVLAESALSFLGFGVQLPEFTWGSMVANGQDYLASAWWVSFFPGLAILLTTLSLNLLGNWLRLATDPHQRWRFVGGKDGDE